MKRLVFVFIILVLVLAACLSQMPMKPGQPGQGNSPTGGTLSLVEHAVVAQLSGNLGLNINDISVLENKTMEFSNACLDVAIKDVMCTQVLTPGHSIVLQADGLQYTYHANEDGSQIQPATLALTWSRDGGIAGFCDRLTVFLSGEVYGSRCNQQNEKIGTFASLLSQQEKGQFVTWIGKYNKVTLDASNPKGVADGMTLVLEFNGLGKSKPDKPVEQEIFAWANALYQKLYK